MENTKRKILGLAVAAAISSSLWGAAPAGSNIMDATFRTSVPKGGQAILGFVVAASSVEQPEVLIRGSCPRQEKSGVPSQNGIPSLVLYRGSLVVGQFNSDAHDQGWIVARGNTWALSLPAGCYSVVGTNTGEPGELSLEIHVLPKRNDAFPGRVPTEAPTLGLTNVSGRTPLATEAHATLDFATRVAGSSWTVVRATGPGLQGMGSSPLAEDPRLTILKNGDPLIRNDDWEIDLAGYGANWPDVLSRFSRHGASLGMQELQHGSKDAEAVMIAFPGFYTAICENRGAAGEILIEVYTQP